uniref:PH domain-containing protein n=1 Tax=Chrysemys picta bellii TaxID=8478 RepID=A0A8C3H7T6_CHRPI
MAAPPDRQGRLYKKSERTSSYQRRWCELRGNLLFYWERQGDREPLGLILLEGCTVELQESPHSISHCGPLLAPCPPTLGTR